MSLHPPPPSAGSCEPGSWLVLHYLQPHRRKRSGVLRIPSTHSVRERAHGFPAGRFSVAELRSHAPLVLFLVGASHWPAFLEAIEQQAYLAAPNGVLVLLA